MPGILPLQLLLATFAGWVTRQQAQVVDYLVEENRMLKEQLRSKRLRLTDDHRRRLAAKARHSAARGSCCCPAAFATRRCLSPVRDSVSSSRHFERCVRISRTPLSCSLRLKAYGTYRFGTAFVSGLR